MKWTCDHRSCTCNLSNSKFKPEKKLSSEAMGLNPVEALNFFFSSLNLQLLKLQVQLR